MIESSPESSSLLLDSRGNIDCKTAWHLCASSANTWITLALLYGKSIYWTGKETWETDGQTNVENDFANSKEKLSNSQNILKKFLKIYATREKPSFNTKMFTTRWLAVTNF